MGYRCLKQQVFRSSEFSLVPIRNEDKLLIMKWRNEQIYHLRQSVPLTAEDQEKYFSTVIANLFTQDKPQQLLFSYLQNDTCIGYGGLVHINWEDRNAEISFIINTELEINFFELHWSTFLSLIEHVAFNDIELHKIFTYAYSLRQHLFKVVEAAGYKEEGRLKEHYLFNGRYIDVFIHSKIKA